MWNGTDAILKPTPASTSTSPSFGSTVPDASAAGNPVRK
jgi:hypothetical protein